MKHATTFFIALTMSAMSLPVMAVDDMTPDESSGWEIVNYELTEIKGKAIDPVSIEILASQALDASGKPAAGSLGFMCLQGDLMVAVSTDTVTIADNMVALWNRMRLRQYGGFLTVDGETGDYKPVAKVRGQDMFLVQNDREKARVYNAVLRGHELSLRVVSKDYGITYAPVDDTFRNFGEACDLGIRARMDKSDLDQD